MKKQAIDHLNQCGFHGNMPSRLLSQAGKKFYSLSIEERDVLLTSLFGTEGSRALNTLIGEIIS